MKAIALSVALTLIASTTAGAQNCSVGIRCGNTCISREDVCRTTTPGGADNTTALIVVFSILGAVIVVSGVTWLALTITQTNPDDALFLRRPRHDSAGRPAR
jgi:hypothetical protein